MITLTWETAMQKIESGEIECIKIPHIGINLVRTLSSTGRGILQNLKITEDKRRISK